jgi:uncharacterized membrane protein YdbT with pleckstrin-like domain
MPEQTLYQAHPPMFRNHPLGFVLSVLLIAVAIGIIILLVWYVKSRSEQLTITNEGLRYEKGILSKTHNELKLTSIRSVRVYQSFFQRMFGTGDVDIFTAGDVPEVTLKGMPDPQQIREIVSEHS